MSEIVGREEHLPAVRAFVGEEDGEAAAFLLEGEAGIGKSTLWLAGVDHARPDGESGSHPAPLFLRRHHFCATDACSTPLSLSSESLNAVSSPASPFI